MKLSKWNKPSVDFYLSIGLNLDEWTVFDWKKSITKILEGDL